MNLQDLVVWLVAAAAAGWLFLKLRRAWQPAGCAGGCGCSQVVKSSSSHK